MTSRERFKAWAKKQGHYDLSPMGGGYWSLSAANAWIGWQAAECDMLERAIAVFDGDDISEYSSKEIQIILKEQLNEPR